MAHSGQPLDYQPDALQGPQLPDEPVGGGAFQQGLLDTGELGVGQPGRRAARSTAAKPIGATRLPSGEPDADRLGRDAKLADDLGLTHTGAEQLGRAQPPGLEPVTFSLCRRAARDRRHPPILARRAAGF